MLIRLERKIENNVSGYAKGKGCLSLKLNVIGQIGWPDRLYLFRGRVLFIEFKGPGESPRAMQLWVINKIREHGFQVEVVDSVEVGRSLIDKFTEGRNELAPASLPD